MAARPRNIRKKGWPDYVYERGGYYSYVSPLDGKEWGLGRDQAKAFRHARAANNHFAAKRDELTLVDRITGNTETLDAWLDIYEGIIAKRKRKGKPLSKNTLRAYKGNIRITRGKIGTLIMRRIDTRVISDLLKEWTDKDQLRMAGAMWSFLFDVFKESEGAGWIDPGHNPVAVATKPSPLVKRARLTFDAFMTIYTAALKLDPWVANSMALALVSTQGRDEISDMEFPHVREGKLWVERPKTGSRVCIPLALRLNAVGWSLDEIVRRCRDNVVSRFLIHHTKKRTKSKPGERVWIDTITKGFRRARNRTDLTWPADKKPPTFHEIRSLSIRLWENQCGAAFAQAMAQHKSGDTTAIYLDTRGAEWVEIKIA